MTISKLRSNSDKTRIVKCDKQQFLRASITTVCAAQNYNPIEVNQVEIVFDIRKAIVYYSYTTIIQFNDVTWTNIVTFAHNRKI